MKGKQIIIRGSILLSLAAVIFGLFISACSHADILPFRSNIVYQKGEIVNLKAENFLDSSVSSEVLKKAILYSPLLDREKYTLDENCNVVSKGKDYLECGTYQVSIAYKDEIKTVQFKVVEA